MLLSFSAEDTISFTSVEIRSVGDFLNYIRIKIEKHIIIIVSLYNN